MKLAKRAASPIQVSREELERQIAELKAKLGPRTLEFRVGEKGGVSVYGLGRFPVTLYYEQWIRLLDAHDVLRTYLEGQRHAGRLKLRDAA